jgi:hypothetical protein
VQSSSTEQPDTHSPFVHVGDSDDVQSAEVSHSFSTHVFIELQACPIAHGRSSWMPAFAHWASVTQQKSGFGRPHPTKKQNGIKKRMLNPSLTPP